MSLTQSKDAGLALTLICLLFAYFRGSQTGLLLAIVILVLAMSIPAVFGPFAKVWFGFSHILGEWMSKAILTVLFIALVIPVGLVRRAMGKDAMRLNEWQKGTRSVFRERKHTFTGADLEKPY